jgi:DNA polymerase III epsilon subunit-like protein
VAHKIPKKNQEKYQMAKILVLDLETTSIDPQRGHIVEIGAVLVDSKTFEIEPFLSKIIKETNEFDRSAWIFQNSSLTPEMVLNHGIPIEQIRDRLQSAMEKYITVAYSQDFDFGWLSSRGFQVPKKGKDPKFICTRILKLPGYYNSYKWPKVQECLEYFKINEIEPHRAFDDARLEAMILIELIQRNEYEILESVAMLNSPDMERLRYQAKIESYDHLKRDIERRNLGIAQVLAKLDEKRAFCEKKLEELQA